MPLRPCEPIRSATAVVVTGTIPTIDEATGSGGAVGPDPT